MYRRCFVITIASACVHLGAVAATAAATEHERSRIDRLIVYVEAQKGMKFIRNGSEYTCEEAGSFLRGKLEAMGSTVRTARHFIEHIASKSSMSGKPYEVRFADGKTMLAETFLVEELTRMERQSG